MIYFAAGTVFPKETQINSVRDFVADFGCKRRAQWQLRRKNAGVVTGGLQTAPTTARAMINQRFLKSK